MAKRKRTSSVEYGVAEREEGVRPPESEEEEEEMAAARKEDSTEGSG